MNIGIIGIGHIGSSLARGLIVSGAGAPGVFDTNSSHATFAADLGLTSNVFGSVEDLAATCDIIFVCIPVTSVASTVVSAALAAREGTIITDVGSVKQAIIAEVEPLLPANIAFVPGHPIAGTEHSGPKHGTADLFCGKPYVFTPTPRTPQSALNEISRCVTRLGALPMILDAGVHDRIFAMTSHLPHVCSFAAVASQADAEQKLGQEMRQFFGGSFRDFTRVAGSDPAMWRDIFIQNRSNILGAIQAYRYELDGLTELIREGDPVKIFEHLRFLALHRRELFPEREAA